MPDTLWLGKVPMSLSIIDSATGQIGNVIRTHKKGLLLYKISVSTHKDEYSDRYPNSGNKQPARVHAPIYKGVALLCYRYRGKKHRIEIARIMKHLYPADYP